MSDVDKFRIRFRFWTLTPLAINEPEHRFMVGDREVVLSGSNPDVSIRQSQWHVMNARGFDSETEAREFGVKLRAAAEISAVATRMGIDTGRDLATTSLSNEIREKILNETGDLIRDNVHGIDVFSDMPNVRIITVAGTGTVSQGPEPFLGDLTSLLNSASQASQQTRDLVLLLSYALKRSEAVAQIVFAISAVEMLGQREQWNKEQQQMLEQVAGSVEAMQIGTPDDRAEVASAIQTRHSQDWFATGSDAAPRLSGPKSPEKKLGRNLPPTKHADSWARA